MKSTMKMSNEVLKEIQDTREVFRGLQKSSGLPMTTLSLYSGFPKAFITNWLVRMSKVERSIESTTKFTLAAAKVSALTLIDLNLRHQLIVGMDYLPSRRLEADDWHRFTVLRAEALADEYMNQLQGFLGVTRHCLRTWLGLTDDTQTPSEAVQSLLKVILPWWVQSSERFIWRKIEILKNPLSEISNADVACLFDRSYGAQDIMPSAPREDAKDRLEEVLTKAEKLVERLKMKTDPPTMSSDAENPVVRLIDAVERLVIVGGQAARQQVIQAYLDTCDLYGIKANHNMKDRLHPQCLQNGCQGRLVPKEGDPEKLACDACGFRILRADLNDVQEALKRAREAWEESK